MGKFWSLVGGCCETQISLVSGCGVMNPKRWWLWIGLNSLVVVGLLLVWVDWFVSVWSLFGWLGSLMILAWVVIWVLFVFSLGL